jgi:uncharacterized protein YcbK (DUF882 family)
LSVFRSAFLVALLLAGSAQASPVARRATAPDTGAGAARSRVAAKNPSRASRKNAPVELFQVNLHESMQIRMRDAAGRPVRGQQRHFDRFLRCHYTNVVHPMNPRLISLIYRTGRHWPGHRVEVVSGYRHPKYAKNPRSPHMKGLACDFRVVGVANTELRDYLRRSFDKVGVGYYPNSSFVHLDIRRDHSAFWIDYSGPGERAMYSSNPSDDMRSGRAEHFRPSKIDESWLDSNAPQAEQQQAQAAPTGEPGVPDPSPAGPAAPAEQPSATP